MIFKLIRVLCASSMLCLVLAPGLRADDKDAKVARSDDNQKGETVDVKIKDLILNVPVSWESVPGSSSMRLATYRIPPAGGDDVPGELTVFNFPGGGGDVGANLARWVGQFEADGRTAEATQGKAGKHSYIVSTVSGTFHKPVGPPIRRQTENVAGYRMVNVMLNVGDGKVYFIKLVGPLATIKAQEKALRASFGGDAEKEEDYEL
jgi:hypothetical protein